MHSALHNKRAWSPNKQRGATLVTVMIIMVMITLLGLTAMRMGMSSLTLATNSQVSNLLFQASDVGMVEFANTVESAAFKGKADIGAGPLAALAAVDVRDIPVTVAGMGTITEFNFCVTPKLAVRLTSGNCDVTNSNHLLSGRDVVAVQVTLKPVDNNEIVFGSDASAIANVKPHKFIIYSTAVMPSFGSASTGDINTCLAKINDDGDSMRADNPELATARALTSVTDCLTEKGAVFSTTMNQMTYGVPLE